jgi:hypothetical protein
MIRMPQRGNVWYEETPTQALVSSSHERQLPQSHFNYDTTEISDLRRLPRQIALVFRDCVTTTLLFSMGAPALMVILILARIKRNDSRGALFDG